MLELTGVGSLLRGISVVYWLLATSALALAIWKGPRWWGKSLGAIAVLLLFGFFPVKGWLEAQKRNAYAQEAWAYFKKLCDEKSGEKIYKTFTGVKSVLVVKPLPPATDRDHFDQYWYGDPYSLPATSRRDIRAAGLLTLDSRRPTGIQKGLRFVEIKRDSSEGVRFQRVSSPPGSGGYFVEDIPKSVSNFGISWEDISTPEDRKYWVAGSRLTVIDLRTKSLVAERIGYFIEAGFGSDSGGRRPWLTSRGPNTTCPSLKGEDYSDQWFILTALSVDEGK
ncbi:MAG: hypothetical protein A3H35_00090 [Betaproteobacteria bacterium RIFCSPLOWO2_02_FULL_62_17]|nr:MAG: hypothetical protein A3H35_00090 [Betaproteobacteria bacterium RIFCSPLOWO2_02_FULL_62_17]